MNNKQNMNLKDVLIRFKPFYKKYKWYFLIAIIGMLMAAAGTSGSAYIVDPVLKKIFIEKNEDMLYIMPLAVIAIYLLKDLGLYIQSYYVSYIGANILKELRAKVLENILKLDMAFFHKHRSGELMSRCTGDIGALQSIVSNIIPEFLRDLITVIGLLSVVIYQSPTLAFFALVVIPASLYPLSLFARKLKKLGKSSQEKGADLMSRLSEIFSNLELIKANNTQKKELDKFAIQNEDLAKISIKSSRIDALVNPIMELFGSVGIATVIMIGGSEVIKGELEINSFFSFLTALFMAYTPIKKLSSAYAKLQVAVAASERTFYLLDLKSNIKDGQEKLLDIENISFKNVKFEYIEDKPVLNGINFNFKKGEILALVGPSGGGKSSIINLLMRFYDKKSGEILLNDKDITAYSLESLRLKIALVTQNIYLFNESIAENVAYSQEFDDNKVINALKEANAYDFVENMGGIYSVIKEHGKNLSGGQKQRIAIARALYKKPDLLIFDEATSALDNESEKAITNSIQMLKDKHLILVIAHRLSTIENADKIAVVDKGLVIDIGTDKELINRCELYQKFKANDKSIDF
ncbi:ABC transporter ATP-binding protein [uncultured Campylobacter sp.]|uniref:ABC transporter ATP-binding protein n=1 Tax=uncultured Campylobacter sp. TaxID=218934 RepID=UPI002636F350|nr:ABC transporter ATP-binding protein [uncultured Campylobacter sp.]